MEIIRNLGSIKMNPCTDTLFSLSPNRPLSSGAKAGKVDVCTRRSYQEVFLHRFEGILQVRTEDRIVCETFSS